MNIQLASADTTAAPSILLVDDEADILPEYRDFLELEGFGALTCSDPEQALQMVLEQPSFRLVITDLRMAKLDGASLIRQIQTALHKERHIKFIIITGDATTQISADLAHIPIFIKPADTDVLITAITTALART